MTMRLFNSLISPSLKKHGLDKQVAIAQILEYTSLKLSEILNDETKKLAVPLRLKNNILTIQCGHSVIAQEVKIKEESILSSIKKRFPGVSIKSVHTIC